MTGICGTLDSATAAAWVTAIAAILTFVVIARGLAYTRAQLAVANRQREDGLKSERTKITLDYLTHFLQARYLVAIDIISGGIPKYQEVTTYVCIDVLATIRLNQKTALSAYERQCVATVMNFCVQLANALARRLVDPELLIVSLAGQIVLLDDILALPVHADNAHVQSIRADQDFAALVALARAREALER